MEDCVAKQRREVGGVDGHMGVSEACRARRNVCVAVHVVLDAV